MMFCTQMSRSFIRICGCSEVKYNANLESLLEVIQGQPVIHGELRDAHDPAKETNAIVFKYREPLPSLKAGAKSVF